MPGNKNNKVINYGHDRICIPCYIGVILCI